MAAFPKLSTGAVIQYPATRNLRFGNQVVRFVDGSEQRFRTAPSILRRWEIRLALLSDTELAELEHFFAANQGTFGTFTFTDPWDDKEYTNCSLEGGRIELRMRGERRGETSLVVRENRI